jgi:hypothetical protein
MTLNKNSHKYSYEYEYDNNHGKMRNSNQTKTNHDIETKLASSTLAKNKFCIAIIQRIRICRCHNCLNFCSSQCWLLSFVWIILLVTFIGAANEVTAPINVSTTSSTNDGNDGVSLRELKYDSSHMVSATDILSNDHQEHINSMPVAPNQSGASEYCITIDGTIDSSDKVFVINSTTQETAVEHGEVEIPTEGLNDDNEYTGVPLGCKLVMAPSTIPNGGWGVFSLVERQPGTAISDGDVVIQVTDFNESNADTRTLQRVRDYFWSAEYTGGYYEAVRVVSALPGIGMLSNGLPDKQHNVLPYVPTVDEGGLVRTDSPGAGAISHYHNLTFFASRLISAGSELFVKYTTNGSDTHQNDIIQSNLSTTNLQQHDLQWLKRHGYCLDNLKPDKSKQPDSGRGVFARRFIPIHGIVAPVPLLLINNRTTMDISIRRDKTFIRIQQLLINYCFGHPKSSILFFPYSPTIK